MILLRKPVKVFDVDALGVAALIALGATVYLTAVVPSRAQAKQRDALLAEARNAEAKVLDSEGRLRGIEQLTKELQATVAERVAASPTRAAINSIVNDILQNTEDSNLKIDSVEPRPPRRQDDHYICDVIMVGRGHAPDVVEFLETLAERHPYHSIEMLSMTGGAGDEDQACRFECHLQLHLLPDDVQTAQEDPS
jgi:Tfp pilus assembly protein PilO